MAMGTTLVTFFLYVSAPLSPLLYIFRDLDAAVVIVQFRHEQSSYKVPGITLCDRIISSATQEEAPSSGLVALVSRISSVTESPANQVRKETVL